LNFELTTKGKGSRIKYGKGSYKKSDLVGVQAIYRGGELIFKDHQARTETEIDQEHVVDKKRRTWK